MTPQQIYDKVCAHLAKQKHSATDKEGTCLYRASNGDMCAAGCLIPDNLYFPGMEFKTIVSLASEFRSKIPDFIVNNIDLVRTLQDCHDHSVDEIGIKNELLQTATRYRIFPGAEQAIKSLKR